jgi:hypothetical protein
MDSYLVGEPDDPSDNIVSVSNGDTEFTKYLSWDATLDDMLAAFLYGLRAMGYIIPSVDKVVEAAIIANMDEEE